MIKVYVSHSIRGPKGANATPKDTEYNNDRIKLIVGRLREKFPEIEFYVPGEHEDFVGLAYRSKCLTEVQILSIDCLIIDTCDLVMIFAPEDDDVLQGGRLVEKDYALRQDIPVLIFTDLADAMFKLDKHLGLDQYYVPCRGDVE